MNGFTPMITVAAHQAHAENIKKSERARRAQAAREASGTRSPRQRLSATARARATNFPRQRNVERNPIAPSRSGSVRVVRTGFPGNLWET